MSSRERSGLRQSEMAFGVDKDSRKPSETGWNVEISASSKIYRLRWKLDSKGTRKVYEIKKFSSNVLLGTGPVWKAVGRTVCSILMVNAEKHTLSSSSILSRAVGAAPLPSLPCRWWGFPSSSLFTHTKKKHLIFWVKISLHITFPLNISNTAHITNSKSSCL